jgi:hypothetical protein
MPLWERKRTGNDALDPWTRAAAAANEKHKHQVVLPASVVRHEVEDEHPVGLHARKAARD